MPFCRNECKIHWEREQEEKVQDFWLQPSEQEHHLERGLGGAVCCKRILTLMAVPQLWITEFRLSFCPKKLYVVKRMHHFWMGTEKTIKRTKKRRYICKWNLGTLFKYDITYHLPRKAWRKKDNSFNGLSLLFSLNNQIYWAWNNQKPCKK